MPTARCAGRHCFSPLWRESLGQYIEIQIGERPGTSLTDWTVDILDRVHGLFLPVKKRRCLIRRPLAVSLHFDDSAAVE